MYLPIVVNTVRENNGVKIKILSKKEILDMEPNLASVFYNGQLFMGSRHTNNPQEISNKIFESFINNGGKNFDLIPCLNDNDDHINLLTKLIKKYLILK